MYLLTPEDKAEIVAIARLVGYRVESAFMGTGWRMFDPEGNAIYWLRDGSTEEEFWQLAAGTETLPDFLHDLNAAFGLIEREQAQRGLEYNLFNDCEGHTCEVGHWGHEPGERNYIWTGNGDTPAIAMVNAVRAFRGER